MSSPEAAGDRPHHPVPSANGLEVKRLLRDHAADPSWPDELATLRATVTLEERDWTG
jgi:hypothetical protein